MKRVLWLVSWYPSRVDAFNGDFIQRHARATALFCKVDVVYVVKDEKKMIAPGMEIIENENLTEKIIYYHSSKTGVRLLDRFLSHLKYTRLYRKAIKEYIHTNGKPGLVHVQIAMKAGLAALWVKKKWNIPFVVTENWTGYYKQSVPSVYQNDWYLKNMNRRVLKDAALFLPVTEDLANTVKQNFVDIPYHVIPNVVNTDMFYYKPFTPAKFRFVHFSYMNYQKNPDGILAAARQLSELGYDFELLMIGNNENWLTDKAAGYSSLKGRVYFIAAVSYEEVARQMQQASALILFSRFENLPCVILEALCCGLPVISSRVGGIAEVLNEVNGIMVESENTVQLAHAMKKMIDNEHFYNRAMISEEATKKFNYNVVGKQITGQYELVLSGKVPGN